MEWRQKMRRYVSCITLPSNGLMTSVLQFRLYLEENGFDTSQMGTRDSDASSDYSNDKTDMKATA